MLPTLKTLNNTINLGYFGHYSKSRVLPSGSAPSSQRHTGLCSTHIADATPTRLSILFSILPSLVNKTPRHNSPWWSSVLTENVFYLLSRMQTKLSKALAEILYMRTEWLLVTSLVIPTPAASDGLTSAPLSQQV